MVTDKVERHRAKSRSGKRLVKGGVTQKASKSASFSEDAIEIAVRDAEIYGTKLAVKIGGQIEELSPDEMRKHLKVTKSKKGK